jgi:hypothetical protein
MAFVAAIRSSLKAEAVCVAIEELESLCDPFRSRRPASFMDARLKPFPLGPLLHDRL